MAGARFAPQHRVLFVHQEAGLPYSPACYSIPASQSGHTLPLGPLLLVGGMQGDCTPDRLLRSSWAEALPVAVERFSEVGYAVLQGPLLRKSFLQAIVRNVQARIDRGHFVLGDGQSMARWWQHNDPLAEVLHSGLSRIVEQLAGKPVRPTYSYLVKYVKGASLPKHTDRGQCQYSLSLLLHYEPQGAEASWPMLLEINGTNRSVAWPPGGALAYKGMEVPHMRGNLPAGHSSLNIFLHYTDIDSKIADA